MMQFPPFRGSPSPAMRLYHFTSLRHLCGIALYGLTVGDVPTDLKSYKGRCGVWLTSSSDPIGHSLDGGPTVDKTRIRLTVNAPHNLLLVKWVEWAATNASPETIRALNQGSDFKSWYIYFGIIEPCAIVDCVDMHTGKELADWRDRSPSPLDLPPVPPSRRSAWHKKLLKKIAKADSAERLAASKSLNIFFDRRRM
jgi:hypothetical protein